MRISDLSSDVCSSDLKGFVISSGDASLLFELSEHALDAVAVLVTAIVGMLWHLAVRAGRDDRQDAPGQQAFPEAITIIALVREQRLGCGDGDRHQRFGSGVIRSLAAGQDGRECFPWRWKPSG